MPFQNYEKDFSQTPPSSATSAKQSKLQKPALLPKRVDIASSTWRSGLVSTGALATIAVVAVWLLSAINSIREEAHRVGACIALDTGAMYGALDDKTRRMVMRAMTRSGLDPNTVSMGSYRVLSATCAGLDGARGVRHDRRNPFPNAGMQHMKIAVGAGRMGRTFVTTVHAADDVTTAGAVGAKGSPAIGRDGAEVAGFTANAHIVNVRRTTGCSAEDDAKTTATGCHAMINQGRQLQSRRQSAG